MRYWSIVLILFSALAHSYPADSEKWQHRSIMFFAPSHDQYVQQFLLETLMEECSLQERDIVTLVIKEDGSTVPVWAQDAFDLSVLNAFYDIPKGQHTGILVGKDGREKLRWGEKTDWTLLKKVIDQMPLRQQEMQRTPSRCAI
ncbi:TPA: DUF4174 domain-containing protein [Vibrio vulnificus]|nr:DUF4174 domain-containing protein [Vibrio vulnificus]HDY7599571.1 DUF4174 domain-containing protein [Vibrio vulnificus]HDY7709304.1 DUF4174 domain-containing protein [Vibrio vulnificus]